MSKLTLKQRKWIREYLKTGNATEASRRAYKTKNNQVQGYITKHHPEVQKALHEAFEKMNIDEGYSAEALKKIIDAGKNNTDQAKPSDALRGLEMFYRLKGYLGNDNKVQEQKEEDRLKVMDVQAIKKELKLLDDRQKRLLAIVGKAEEGEVVDDDTQD
jgi:phage terminase small subunit